MPLGPLRHQTPVREIARWMSEAAATATDDECQEWPFGRDEKGYAVRGGHGNQSHYVTHAILERAGLPRPAAANALHSCDNPPCVNRFHLRWGTQAENIADMFGRVRNVSLRGDEHPQSRLTADDVRKIRGAHADGETQVALAERFGVTFQNIHRIVRRKTWRHLP